MVGATRWLELVEHCWGTGFQSANRWPNWKPALSVGQVSRVGVMPRLAGSVAGMLALPAEQVSATAFAILARLVCVIKFVAAG